MRYIMPGSRLKQEGDKDTGMWQTKTGWQPVNEQMDVIPRHHVLTFTYMYIHICVWFVYMHIHVLGIVYYLKSYVKPVTIVHSTFWYLDLCIIHFFHYLSSPYEIAGQILPRNSMINDLPFWYQCWIPIFTHEINALESHQLNNVNR